MNKKGIAMSEIKLGIYRHFKGNLYEVTGFATHSETLEKMVIYKPLYGKGDTWVRPIEMWNETVELGDMLVLRFQYIGESVDNL